MTTRWVSAVRLTVDWLGIFVGGANSLLFVRAMVAPAGAAYVSYR